MAWPSSQFVRRSPQLAGTVGRVTARNAAFAGATLQKKTTGNASNKFRQLDRYVTWRLKRLLIKKRGRNLHAGQADKWTEAWFHDQGLHQLMGTIRYPKAA